MNCRLALAFLLALLVACGSDPAVRSADEAPRDSAGVLLRHLPAFADIEAPRWKSEVIYSTLTLDVPPLFAFADARFTADTNLILGHDTELLVLSPQGQVLRVVGRNGDGPGEFRMVTRLGIGRDGTLLVGDGMTQRITVLNPVTRAPRVIPFLGRASATYEKEILTRLANGQIVATFWQDRPNRDTPGIRRGPFERDSAPLLVYDSTGKYLTTVGTWLGLERTPTADIGGQQVRLPPAFARTALAQGRGEFTAISTTDSLDLSL